MAAIENLPKIALRRAAAGLVFTTLLWAQRTPFRPADLAAWRTVTEVRIAPDGSVAAYVDSGANEKGERASSIWIATTDGRARRPLTQGAARDWSPSWPADPPEGMQRMAYLSDRAGRVQIRLWTGSQDSDIAGVTQAPLAIAISPRGDAVAFTAIDQQPRTPPAWAPISILPFLRAVTPHAQVYIAQLKGGAVRRLTQGDLDWIGAPAWMPDGQAIVCAATAGPDPEHPLQRGSIFSVRTTDGAMTQLTESEGDDSSPTPSPDGSRIAWLSTAGRAQSYNLHRLFVMNRDGSRSKQLAAAFDRDVSHPQWSSDSRTVYFVAEDSGAAHLYAARNEGSFRQVTRGKERLRDFSLADNGRAAAVRSSATEAGDVISFAIDLPGGVTTLYAPDEHLIAEREIGGVEEFSYPSEGHSIQAWLIHPPQFDPARKYPLLLDLHDSPRAMYGYDFQLRAQILASAGFVVLLANPRGSPGYGEEFGNLLATRNPGDDAADLARGVDAALAKGSIDSKRVCVSGGLVAAWMLEHSDRFASAVLHDAVADRAAEIALGPDPLRRAMSELGALPWADPAQYWQHSPIYFAGAMKTPTLVIGREGDAQAREIYFALQTRKVDSALVEFPREGQHNVEELEAEIAWLKR